jgi:phosphate transport system ATP-binding protein
LKLDKSMVKVTERPVAEKPHEVHGKVITVNGLSAFYGKSRAVDNISMSFHPGEITAIIGPSGCGKSTMIRCINRMHEEIIGASISGQVLLGDDDIYAPEASPMRIRRKIGMVFQKPNPFPTMSIHDNVLAGLKLNAARITESEDDIVERCLREVALWDEVKDKLSSSGVALSGGQQQRLCIARAIAVKPEVLLLDEPCSALDPIATLKIEELLLGMRNEFTIILVTHNMQQAARVSDKTAFFLGENGQGGRLIEYSPTTEIFTTPKEKRTEDYISGRFG